MRTAAYARALTVWLAIVPLVSCGSDDVEPMPTYSITIVGSTAPKPLKFAGSYQFMRGKKRITRDLTGRGSYATSFFADDLVYVRVTTTSRGGIYSLQVRLDGQLLFDSPAVEAGKPIIYSNQ